MKIGLLFECGPEGPDKKICEAIINSIQPKIDAIYRGLDDKPGLIEKCGNVSAALIADGCERIIIVWDLYPGWREDGQTPCRHSDKEAIYAALDASKVDRTKVFLVCIQQELEAWLLADNTALEAYFSRPEHPAKIKVYKKPDEFNDPKGEITGLTIQYRGRSRRYADYTDAIKIFQKIHGTAKLRKSPSFQRFVEKVTGQSFNTVTINLGD